MGTASLSKYNEQTIPITNTNSNQVLGSRKTNLQMKDLNEQYNKKYTELSKTFRKLVKHFIRGKTTF